MKTIKLLFIIMTAALLAFTACRVLEETSYSDDETLINVPISLCVDATKGGDDTKALTLSGSTLNASWTAGDEVKVYKEGNEIGTLVAQSSGVSVKLKGTLTATVSSGNYLTLKYLSPDYRNQDGTIAYIASNCDYAVAENVLVQRVVNNVATLPAVTFVNKQAITKFSFKVSGATVYPSKVKITSESGQIVGSYIMVTPSSSSQPLYVAISNTKVDAKDVYHFEAEVGSTFYTGTKKANLTAGQYYEATVNLAPPVYSEPAVIDFGLDVLWGSFNLGATASTEYGEYFAWGETDTKFEFSKSNYAYWNGSAYTKYTSSSAVLEEIDDAASVSLGGTWRMPTYEEWQALVNRCTWTFRNVDDVPGFEGVYSGKKIFLPLGFYWTSTRYTDSANDLARIYESQSIYSKPYSNTAHRYEALYIRPVFVPVVSVTGVTLPSSRTVNLGSTTTLTATISPEDATNKSVVWTSSDSSIATVDNNGMVTGVRAGTAVITVTTVDGNHTASCTVTVKTVAVTSISIYPTAFTMSSGGTQFTLTPSVSPSNATDPSLSWSSSNTAVATVSSSGTITSVSPGTATITIASVSNPSITKTCTVTVKARTSGTAPSGAVNLGLTTYWATCNLGASNESSYGSYYSWAALSAGGTSFSWSNCRYYTGTKKDYEQFSKYVLSSSCGTVDNLSILDSSDDTARAILGSGWRMPTIEEFYELQRFCTWTSDSVNGQAGVRATSKINGNSIFFVFAGYYPGSYRTESGSRGYYWTSELAVTNSNDYQKTINGHEIIFNSSGVYGGGACNRCCGLSIRPVHD